MPKFLTTRKVTSTLEDIITDSNEILVLFSPYVFIPFNMVDRLKAAVERKVKVTLVTRGDFRDAELKKWEHIGLTVLLNYDLHAKAYYNENEAIITSFNLIDSSEKFNIEFGMSVSKKEDEQLYNKIVSECDLVVKKSSLITIINGRHHINDRKLVKKIEENNGFCIRCHTSLNDKNPLKPYCLQCYDSYSVYNNPNYIEKFCHFCGTPYATSKKAPLCNSCQLEHDSIRL